MNTKTTEFMLASIESNPEAKDFRRQVFLDDLMMFKESDEFGEKMALCCLTKTLNSQQYLDKLMQMDQSWADE